MEEMTEARLALKRKFLEYFENTDYSKRLRETVLYKKADVNLLRTTRVTLNTHDIRSSEDVLLKELLNHPTDALPSLEEAMKDVADEDVTKVLQENDAKLMVGVDGDFGKHAVSPRELTCKYLGKLVKVYGIVIRASVVRPKVVKSVHFCEATKLYTTREYRDVTSFSGLPTGASYPIRDDNSNLLVTEYGLCKYRDSQRLTLQELPETAPAGQMPHSVDVIIENDLVDSCKPGDRVAVVGVYRAISPKSAAGPKSCVFQAMLIANHVERLTNTGVNFWTSHEADVFRNELSKREDLLDLMASSLAPSIFGHHVVKKGLVLMLVGGQEKNLDTGTHLRGDINCMMVGDPGVAKSQLLRAVMKIAPHAVSTSGRGSSGVGLTAAVATDAETGEKRLEAGAMVLADRGVVCIDEFDKMSDVDRVAIHEVMEQQTVTIAKAGIHTSLNARCSVFAAANPLYGTYEPSIPVTKNINLPDSLLSRFDLLFIVRDHIDGNRDREIASHVLGQHRYRAPWDDGRGEQEKDVEKDGSKDEKKEYTSMEECFMPYDARLHGPKGPERIEPLRTGVIRKYIAWLRSRYTSPEGKPVQLDISEEAMEEMMEYFAGLRKDQTDRALPVTARTLETVIRLSTAHAKLRCQMHVDVEDVEVAKQLMDYVMRSETSGGEVAPNEGDNPPARSPRARRGGNRGDGDDNDDDDDGDDNNDGIAPGSPPPSQRRRAASQPSTSQPAPARTTRSTSQAAASAPSTSKGPAKTVKTGPKGVNQAKLKEYVKTFVNTIATGGCKSFDELIAYLAEQGITADSQTCKNVIEQLSVEHRIGHSDYQVPYCDDEGFIFISQ